MGCTHSRAQSPEGKAGPQMSNRLVTLDNTESPVSASVPNPADAPANTSQDTNPNGNQTTASAEGSNSAPADAARDHDAGTAQTTVNAAATSVERVLPPPPPPLVPAPIVPVCSICTTAIKEENGIKEIKPCRSCKNSWCVDCLRQVFLGASKDESRMPPRCCIVFHHGIVKPYLKAEEFDLFKSKFEEWCTPNRTYCPVPTCSAFIPPRLFPKPSPGRLHPRKSPLAEQKKPATPPTPNPVQTVVFATGVKMDIHTPPPTPPSPSSTDFHSKPTELVDVLPPSVHCPSCSTAICSGCKKLAHTPYSCPSTTAADLDPELAAALQRWGIKRCPKCRAGVRRMHGCSHMRCRCGAQFCWYCTGPIERCRENGCEQELESDQRDREINGDDDEVPDDEHEDEAENNPEETEEAREERRQGRQAERDAARRAQVQARQGNLDARLNWYEQGLNFGAEPNVDEQDVWACDHRWRRVVEGEPRPEVERLECQRCFEEVLGEMKYPEEYLVDTWALFDCNDEKITSDNAYLDGVNTLFDNDEKGNDATTAAAASTSQTSNEEHLARMVDEQRRKDSEESKNTRRQLQLQEQQQRQGRTAANAAWECTNCYLLVCGACKKEMGRNVPTTPPPQAEGEEHENEEEGGAGAAAETALAGADAAAAAPVAV